MSEQKISKDYFPQSCYNNETDTYPQSSIIKYRNCYRQLTYTIIKEGTYPSKNILAYTKKPNSYKIPDNLIVETIYGKKKTSKKITCHIKYICGKPYFRIEFNENNFVQSKKSASTVANKYQKVIIFN